jgi:hypothetical protein
MTGETITREQMNEKPLFSFPSPEGMELVPNYKIKLSVSSCAK